MSKLVPNIKRGGKAKPIGSNLYYMAGRKHSQGGIDIGDTLEVEGGEVVQTDKNEVKVFSAQPILNGKSPAKLVMGGANPDSVFNAQEEFKDRVGLNDDGTKKQTNMKKLGGNKERFPIHTGEYYGRTEGRAIKALRNARTNSNFNYNGNTNFTPNTDTSSMYDSLPVAANSRTAIQQTNRQYNNPTTSVSRTPAVNTAAPTAAPVANKRQSFNDAFAAARKSGVSTFNWNGKSYGTQLANTNKPTRPANELPEVTVTAPRVETINRELPEVNVYGSSMPSALNRNRYTSSFRIKKCGGKKAGGGLVTVNGNVVNKVIGNVAYPSSTGGRRKAALGTKERDKDYVYWNGKLHRVTKDEFGETAYEPVDDRLPNTALADGRGAKARQSDREVRAAARRDAKKSVENSPLLRGGNFGERDFKPVGYKTNGNRSNTSSTRATTSSKQSGRNEVAEAARRAAANPRTDFRDMLRRPEYTPDKPKVKDSNKPASRTSKPSMTTQSTTSPANSTNTKTQTASAPRRGSDNGTTKPKSTTKAAAKKPATKSTQPVETKTAPKFDSLESMMQGLPTNGSITAPSKLEQRPRANVPDIISSPKKRLALFDNLDAGDIVGLGSNLAGSIASGINSRKQLDKMQAPLRPNSVIAENMKTSFNINPQLGEIEENSRRMTNDINANTSSSKTRLQRLQRLSNNKQSNKNNLRGQKENIETQLINQDKANKQQVRAANVAAQNDWMNRTTEFQNSIREQKATSLNNMFSGINSGIQDMLGRIENRKNYKNTLAMYDATHPNVDKRLFKDKGVKF